MALVFMDSFEQVPWPSIGAVERRPQTAPTIVIKGPTWYYVGRGGIEIVRVEHGHAIRPLRRDDDQSAHVY